MLRLGSSVRHRSAKGKVWGSDEVNVEGWKPLKRLVGHESGEFPYALSLSPQWLTIPPPRRHGRRMVSGRSIPGVGWIGFCSVGLVWVHLG